ncbi:MAG: hypothetical protein ACYCW6_02670, partial [Candidatus Xenobia bacterium]
LLLMLRGRQVDFFPGILYRQARRVRIAARRHLPVRVDTDLRHRLPVSVHVLQGALRVGVPALQPVTS